MVRRLRGRPVKKLTQKRLKEVVSYNPETGIFINLKSRGRAKIGTRAGSEGKVILYRYIAIDKCLYAEHRLAFLYVLGRFPDPEVDHINGKGNDNRWANLREATRVQNLANSIGRRDDQLKGTYQLKSGRWQGRFYHAGKHYQLGNFATAGEAHEAYKKKAKEVHGTFAKYQ